MRKNYALFATIILLTLLLLLYRIYSERIEKAKIDKPLNNNYTLISIDGRVSLYRDNELIQIYDNINPNSLPLQDRDNLKSGIKLQSLEEATQIIEDFDG